MFKSKKFAFLSLFSFMMWCASPLYAQNCYEQLDDASGFDTSPYQDSLEAAACELIDAFPDSTYADSFKVYSFGFYVDLDFYDDYSYPQAFDDVTSEVAKLSDYYLLIGRQTDRDGIFTKYMVDILWPEGGQFSCLTPEAKEAARQLVEIAINGRRTTDPTSFFEAEKAGISELQHFIESTVYCCQEEEGPESQAGNYMNTCGCVYTETKMASLLINNGFLELIASNISVSEESYSGELNSSHQIIVTTISGHTFNLTGETQSFLQMSGIDGEVHISHFSDLPGECELFSEGFIGYVALKYGSSGGGGGPPLSALDYEEDIVLINSGGQYRLFYQFKTNGEPIEFRSGDDEGIESGAVVVPVLAYWILRKAAAAGVGILIHVGASWCLEKWFGDHDEWIPAWNALSFTKWELFKAGVEGVFGVNNVLGTTAVGFALGAVGYLIQTPTDQITLGGFFSSAFIEGMKVLLISISIGIAAKAIQIAAKYTPRLWQYTSDFQILLKDFIDNPKLLKSWNFLVNHSSSNLRLNVTYLKKLVDDVVPQSTIIKTADDVNTGPFPPYLPGTNVEEIVLSTETFFVRVHRGSENSGDWLMRLDDFKKYNNKDDLIDAFAIPHGFNPFGQNRYVSKPDRISIVKVPEGETVRKGTANGQIWVNGIQHWGGATQYEILGYSPTGQQLPQGWFEQLDGIIEDYF